LEHVGGNVALVAARAGTNNFPSPGSLNCSAGRNKLHVDMRFSQEESKMNHVQAAAWLLRRGRELRDQVNAKIAEEIGGEPLTVESQVWLDDGIESRARQELLAELQGKIEDLPPNQIDYFAAHVAVNNSPARKCLREVRKALQSHVKKVADYDVNFLAIDQDPNKMENFARDLRHLVDETIEEGLEHRRRLWAIDQQRNHR
jgi:hypothetical protein